MDGGTGAFSSFVVGRFDVEDTIAPSWWFCFIEAAFFGGEAVSGEETYFFLGVLEELAFFDSV